MKSIEENLARVFPHNIGTQYKFVTPSGESTLYCRGLATRQPANPVTAATTFHSFSTTKPITALAVLQLAENGRLSIDAPLANYLPEIPYRNGATVRQILSHQGGLPNPLPLSWIHLDREHSQFDANAFIDTVLRANPTCKPAGQKTAYSNIGFLLLGRLIERLSGLSYTNYIQQHVLDVVHANDGDDAYLGFDLPVERHATGYTSLYSPLGWFIALLPDRSHLRSCEGAWIRYRPFHLNGAAYGGLKGNVTGWSRLLLAVANRDPRLLPASWYDAWYKVQNLSTGKPTEHALSWFVGNHRGHSYLCHAGGGPGYYAEIRIYPELRAASALMANTTFVTDQRFLDQLDATWLG